MNLHVLFAEQLAEVLPDHWTKDKIKSLIETPKQLSHGDVAFPCFQLAKEFRQSPADIAKMIASKLTSPLFKKVEAVGPYVNVFFDKSVGDSVVNTILQEQHRYGSHTFGQNKTVVIDMSSPNIAKPFSMGHLRSTVIGQSIALLAEKCGFRTVKINHLGDWGTQFGKLITAYRLWGNEAEVKEKPIASLFQLYVRFHEEAAKDKSLEDVARKTFKALEDGDEEALLLWKWFRDESLQAFKQIYELLNVSFDSYHGEAFYNDKMEDVIELLKQHQLLVLSDGAEVVDLADEQLPPCLIKKSDGATLYATRDLAAALYRQREYKFDQAIYVVGHEQSIHFQQIFAVLKKLGFDWAKNMVHVPFGLYLKDGKKMSTRKGRVILLEEVLNEAIQLAKENIERKNPHLPNKEKVAKAVGVGAIVFHDLKSDRMNSIEFSLEDMLHFEGETGPYVQYTHARAHSLLRKHPLASYEYTGLSDEDSWEIVKLLQSFPAVIEEAYKQLAPHLIAKYVIQLAQAFNKYYGKVRILANDEELPSRLALVKAVTIVLAEGLRLLRIQAPNEM
jgi:arginyl-tRNA synthetase